VFHVIGEGKPFGQPHADVSYELDAGGTTSIIEIPIHWGLDDWEQYC
jgi:hypothetical protein